MIQEANAKPFVPIDVAAMLMLPRFVQRMPSEICYRTGGTAAWQASICRLWDSTTLMHDPFVRLFPTLIRLKH